MKPPANLDHQSTWLRLPGVAGVLLAHFIALCLFLVVMVKVVPVFELLFEQQGIVLPARTQSIITLSMYCTMHFVGILLVGIVIDAAVLLAISSAARGKRWVVIAYSHLWLLLAIGALVYVTAWISNPIASSLP